MSLVEKNAAPASDFAEQMRQAEQEAGVPSDQELYAEYGVEHPQPDDQGRIPVSRPDDAEVEAQAEAEAEPAPEASEPEPEPQVDQLAEVNKKLGQLINENAQLRQQVAEFQQQPEPAQQPYVPMGDVSWFEQVAEENPAQAAQWALQQQQPFLYDRAVRSWYEQDPVAAGRFERQVEQAALTQNIQQALQPQIATATEAANKQQLEAAMTAVASRHDDFAEVMGSMTPENVTNILQSGLPVGVLEQGLTGDQQAKEQVFETLYRWQKAEVAGQLVQAAKEAPRRQSDEAREAKKEAFVGSATTTTPDEVPETEAERQARVWAEMRPSLSSAWTGRDSRQRLGR